MLKGKTIQELAKELDRQATTKRDFVAPAEKIEVVTDSQGNLYVEGLDPSARFGVARTGHEQFGKNLGIPKPYYDRMLNSAPSLLAASINTWGWQENKPRLVRTLDGNVRAVLSDKYRIIDSAEMMKAVMPVLVEENVTIRSCEVTERKMFIQASLPSLTAEPKVGEIVEAGVVLSNSEIGGGGYNAEEMIYVLRCGNGMVAGVSLRKFHIGRRQWSEDEDNAREVYADDTRMLENETLHRKVRDITRAALSETHFRTTVQKITDASDQRLEGRITEVIEIGAQRLGLNETEKDDLLQSVVENKDYTRWGLIQGITSLAHKAKDYDRAIDFERLGGAVLELPRTQFVSMFAVA